MTRRVEGNPYRVYRHPETGHWCLGFRNTSVHAPLRVTVHSAQMRDEVQRMADDAAADVDRLMDELASARMRRDALRDILDEMAEDDS